MSQPDIERYIPQREPIVMVDSLDVSDDNTATTTLTITRETYFTNDNGTLAEAGLIEHIAQSASALAGFTAVAAGAQKPPVGYIGEVKGFRCRRLPSVGETLHTTVSLGEEFAGVSIASGETRIGDETIAFTELKISMEQG